MTLRIIEKKVNNQKKKMRNNLYYISLHEPKKSPNVWKDEFSIPLTSNVKYGCMTPLNQIIARNNGPDKIIITRSTSQTWKIMSSLLSFKDSRVIYSLFVIIEYQNAKYNC